MIFDEDSRKVKALFIPNERLLSILSGSVIVTGLPEDARIVTCYAEPMKLGVTALVYSEAFEVIEAM